MTGAIPPIDKAFLALLATAYPSGAQFETLVGRMTEAQFETLVGRMTEAQFATLVARMSDAQFATLVARMSDAQFATLVGSMSDAQFATLVGSMSDAQFATLVGSMTEAQFATLVGSSKIPKIENLYSRILDDLREEKRILDQWHFGPQEMPAFETICRTPMCMAGHTVNLAGPFGYDLKKRFGFAGAALLIHRVSRPDAPAPRYDAYPNEWALAYIEMRAEEEQKAGAA